MGKTLNSQRRGRRLRLHLAGRFIADRCGLRDRVGQGHATGIRPESFQVPELASLRIEQVHDRITVVEHDPTTFLIALTTTLEITVLLLEHQFDLISHGMNLTSAGARRDHKEIKNRRQLPQVEHDEVSASRFGCDASGGDRTFEPCVSGRIRVRAMVWARHAVLVGQGDDRR